MRKTLCKKVIISFDLIKGWEKKSSIIDIKNCKDLKKLQVWFPRERLFKLQGFCLEGGNTVPQVLIHTRGKIG